MTLQARHYRDEVRQTVTLALPVVLTQLAQISMGFIDTVMVGRLGPAALAGVALGNAVFFMFLIVCMGVTMAVGPMVSQAYGAGTYEPIGRSVRQGLWLGLVLAVPATVLLWHIGPVLLLAGQDAATAERAQRYLRAIAWGFLPFLWFVVLRSFIEGVSRPRPVTVIAFAGVGLNVAANYVLMFGKLGFPALGLVGTGWASTFVYWMMFLLLLGYTVRRHDFRVFRLFERIGRPDGQYFRELFRIGWPIGASMGVEMSLFMMAVMMMGWISPAALAAHQVAIQCAAFTFMVPLGIGMAASVRVGQAAGRGDAGGVRRAGVVAVGLAALFMLGAALVFWTAPRAVVSLYLDLDDPANAEVIRLAVSLLGIAAVFQVFDGVQVSAIGALRGLKDTRVPLLIGMLAYWLIGVTSSYVLGFPAGFGAAGLWWGLVLGLAAAAALLSWRFHRQSRPGRLGAGVPAGAAVEPVPLQLD
ncbi:MAG: MATE family efflux transporter [Rhodothermaceae bacterium]|uniref:MATE family efflux transporter n=1 Tax=Rhodocaloribacter litoris TaxID=2558931 RepID=UPI001E3FCC5F|nr:MATE family efflux transporter [Rhodocaloribacter litoris]GIV61578.1 MAG: MATE family efflux transporter [Rhodothermaceae bacterium]